MKNTILYRVNSFTKSMQYCISYHVCSVVLVSSIYIIVSRVRVMERVTDRVSAYTDSCAKGKNFIDFWRPKICKEIQARMVSF